MAKNIFSKLFYCCINEPDGNNYQNLTKVVAQKENNSRVYADPKIVANFAKEIKKYAANEAKADFKIENPPGKGIARMLKAAKALKEFAEKLAQMAEIDYKNLAEALSQLNRNTFTGIYENFTKGNKLDAFYAVYDIAKPFFDNNDDNNYKITGPGNC